MLPSQQPLLHLRATSRHCPVVGVLFLVLAWANPSHAADAFSVPKDVQTALTTYCIDCHGAKGGKGNVRLVGWENFPLNERLDVLNKVQDQLFFQMMPPASAETLPAKERATISTWVRRELQQHKASKLDEKLPYPDAGNYVDHAALFNGTSVGKPASPARRWLVSPAIFTERVLDVFALEGREREGMRRSGFYGVNNPFVLPEHAGVRYYDLGRLNGGHLLVMLGNAEWIATKLLYAARLKAGHKDEGPVDIKDKWFPKTTPTAWEAIVLKKDPPTVDELQTAIQLQFRRVLQRPATASELDKYLAYTQDAIKAAGNAEGLRQMLKTVLLESEFVYRLEFGSGPADDAGRLLLSPREAAYAIAYALSDRSPDATLLKAAENGQLTTKADYEREVKRILNDKTNFSGRIDPSLGPRIVTTVTHPKLQQFFREFFGYPMAVKVFKDTKRADGLYSNADRGSTGTPGYLVDEADRVVDWVLTRDKAVFETLLTTEQNFVYHTMSNDKGEQLIAQWKKAYDILKTTDWKNNPDIVAAQHQDTIKKYLDPKGLPGRSSRRVDHSLTRYMLYFDYTFGHGRTPFTSPPWAFGNQSWYAPIYNLPRMPGRDGKYGGNDAFDYHATQPFALPNRKGILTHPAWLIAFSANSHTDPIRRGRWIREKLLAGVVPDVPITVDAKIPDDAPKTLRERIEHATKAEACTKCHQRMNNLGYPLEIFDDFGRHRTLESLEHPDNLVRVSKGNDQDVYKTKPIHAAGVLDGTGDPALDGPVQDAFDLLDRLARSDRARQSIIRHAFRFFMGRNELLSDAVTLRDADRAYVQSGGSFKAVVVSLLTSDSFRYRLKVGTEQ